MAVGGDNHRDQSSRCLITGEPHFLRDRGLARPQNAFAYGEEDLVVLAVRLLAGIAQSHASLKVTSALAFWAMMQFLNANGYDLAIEDSAAWADTIIALVEHRITEEDFVRVIRPFVVPR